MIDFIKTKKIYLALITVLFVSVSLSDATYSLFIKSNDGGEVNYNTGLLDLKFLEDDQIVLENAFPVNDSEGMKTKPYTLTIKNTGSIPYLFDLKMLASNEEAIDYKYIKVKVNDNLPQNLADSNNTLESNLILYPFDEITFKIYIWLDINTPNSELGKSFTSKVTTSGSSIYKTIDKSGANYPKLNSEMLSVYYDENDNVWRKADRSNLNETYRWYDYDNKEWANSVTIKDSDKYIIDLAGSNNIKNNDVVVNNGNLILKDKYLDLDVKYNSNIISNFFRIKIDEESNNVNIISNGNLSYYYNFLNKTFTFKNGQTSVNSDSYELIENHWYIIGYTYDGSKVTFYVDGEKISEHNISGNIGNNSFKLGTNNNATSVSKITIGDVLFYNRVLSDNEINNNYKTSLSVIEDGLIHRYSEFTPMTLREYYLSSTNGTIIKNEDISGSYVWIPRFKYKVWNVLGEKNIDTYNAKENGIEIIFENGSTSSGTIYCNGTECYSDIDKTIKVTSTDNNKYYTHPAFKNANEELTGLWVSKYELSNTNEYLSTYYEQIKNISKTNNYHVIKNTEWGAVSYLAYSKYGLCTNGKCINIDTNNTSDVNDSTTLNMSGVFDLSSGYNEYTMSNISTNNNLNLINSHFGNNPIDNNDYEIYQKDTFILGDATYELNKNDTLSTWYVRKGLFDYTTSEDVQDGNITTRIVTK